MKDSRMTRISTASTIYVTLFVLLSFCFYLISPYALILVIFGLLPGFIAIVIDQDRDRYISHIVTSLNIAGLVPYLYKILRYGSSSVAIELIIDPKTWLVIYSAAAVGWIIYWLIPQVAILFFTFITKSKINRLNAELDDLAREWGEDIKRN
jgi:hypothetical protein